MRAQNSISPSKHRTLQFDDKTITDEELTHMVKPELISLNIPSVLEFLLGLFLLFIALMKLPLGWTLLNSNTRVDLARGFLIEGFVFIALMCLCFYVAYGIILKSKYASFIGLGKGIFFIFYFTHGIYYYHNLAANIAVKDLIFLSDLNERALYETNMYINGILLIYVLILTVSIAFAMYKTGYFDRLVKKSGSLG